MIVGCECVYPETGRLNCLGGYLFVCWWHWITNRMADGYFLPHYVDNNFEMQRQAAKRKTKWTGAAWGKGHACLASASCHFLNNSNHNIWRSVGKHIWGSQCIDNKVTSFVFLSVTWSKVITYIRATYCLSVQGARLFWLIHTRQIGVTFRRGHTAFPSMWLLMRHDLWEMAVTWY